MRPALLLAALLPAAALAAPGPTCAIAASPASEASQTQAAPAAPTSPPASPAALQDGLASLPFAKHVAASSGAVTDLGTAHGLHGFAARSGDQFMVFYATSDGQAAVSGAPVELSADQIRMVAGAENVTELAPEHGLTGLFVRSGPSFQVFYVTPDGQRLIPGVLWDADGKDVTRRQVADIPGAIPTVEVNAPAAADAGAPAPAALAAVEASTYGLTGFAGAPRLFMLFDPQCVYSVRAFQMLQPYIRSGRVQVALVPLSVLDYEDKGQSTRSAVALLSKPADQLAAAWQSGDLKQAPSPDSPDRLRTNMAVAQAIHLTGTPTFVWRKPDGSEGRLDGIPTDVEALVASVKG